MISVLVVDDHSFIRSQVRGVLHGADGIEVVGECADGAEVVSMAALVRPDVVLMDVRMPITSGPAATRDLLASRPASRFLILSALARLMLIVTGDSPAGDGGRRDEVAAGGPGFRGPGCPP